MVESEFHLNLPRFTDNLGPVEGARVKQIFLLMFVWSAVLGTIPALAADTKPCAEIKQQLLPGDLVFIGLNNFLFSGVAKATLTWTNHVGIAMQTDDGQWVIYESRIPTSTISDLCEYIDRAIPGHVGIRRLPDLTAEDVEKLKTSATARLGILYHQGFDYESWRQFCSKFVFDVFAESGKGEIGKIQTFRELLNEAEAGLPANDFAQLKKFFDFWFFPTGGIPYERKTITPKSQWADEDLISILEPVFETAE